MMNRTATQSRSTSTHGVRSLASARTARDSRKLMSLVAVSLLVLAANRAAAADSPVLHVSSKPYYGQTYGEWVVGYWQWAMSFPVTASPWFSDEDGSLAGLGQSGPVWFLGGTPGNSVTRTFSMPAGKAIFLPVHQWIFGATVFDCEPSVSGVPCDVPTLKKSAADAAKAVTLMEVSVDGQAVPDVKDYRVKSPSSFSVTVPEKNVAWFYGVPVPAGTYSPHVADGYYMLLAPLSVGLHTISVHVVSPLFGGFDYSITYHITVVAE